MTSPFELGNQTAYTAWRDQKLINAITNAKDLIVEINDPCTLTSAERDTLLTRCGRSNMVIYASSTTINEQGLQSLGAQLGLNRLDANWLAGEQGVTRITVCHNDGKRQAYIPYTDKAIKWHTDGYYNPPERQIGAMVLHCAQNAGQGGENRIMDHEIAYLMLRDINPEYIGALSEPDAMTIPARFDEQGIARAAQSGPVFSVNADGLLHMRYTARTRSIEWKQDEMTLASVATLESILASDSVHIHKLQLEPGMGLLCNNVLHDRSAFTDNPDTPRLLFRARYLDYLTRI